MTESLSADKKKLRGKLRTGTLLRGYVIDSVLGYGGFGIVYGAHHAEVGYPIALKEFLPRDLSVREGDSVRPRGPDCYEYFEDEKRRFLEEAKQLVQFRRDPGVVSCLDFFRANGTAYLVMEHVEGLSLAELLHRKEKAGSPLDEAQMVSVMVPLLEALSRVHAAGVLHRDITPSNILIRREDSRPVLIDFGAAKQNAAQHSKSLAPHTEGYAAIEQVGGGDLGPWTDLYGVGAVMWRIVAGASPPWDPPTPVSVVKRMHAISRDDSDPLPSAVTIGDGKIAHQVLQAIDKCLRIREAERFQTCKELLDALQDNLSSLGQASGSLSPRVKDVRIMTSPSNGYAYGAGEEIKVRVEFDLSLKVTGSPQLALDIGGRACQAILSNRWEGQLSFKYLVRAEDLDADGLSVPRSALTLNGGSIRSMAAAPVVLDLGENAIRHDQKHAVDGRILSLPRVRGVRIYSRPSNRTIFGWISTIYHHGWISTIWGLRDPWIYGFPSNGTIYGAGEMIIVRVDFDLPLMVTGRPQLEVKVGDRMRQARYYVNSVDPEFRSWGQPIVSPVAG